MSLINITKDDNNITELIEKTQKIFKRGVGDIFDGIKF